MISPEILRRYPFFSFLTDAQRKALAMIAEEAACEAGAVIFEEGDPASDLYLLLDGSIDLYFTPRAKSWSAKSTPANRLASRRSSSRTFSAPLRARPNPAKSSKSTAPPCARCAKWTAPSDTH